MNAHNLAAVGFIWLFGSLIGTMCIIIASVSGDLDKIEKGTIGSYLFWSFYTLCLPGFFLIIYMPHIFLKICKIKIRKRK